MTDDTRAELLPCPFCGGDAQFVRNEECGVDGEPHENYSGEWIECAQCLACTNIMFPLMDSVRGQLAERWNMRAALTSERARCAEIARAAGRDDIAGAIEGVGE